MSSAYLSQQALPGFLTKLANGERRVLAPVRQGKAVVFAPWQEGGEFTLERATVPPKAAVLPPCETLLTYKRAKDPNDLGKLTLVLDDKPKAEPTVVFAPRPCDARGFAVLDRPYLQGPFADPYYTARRKSLVVITRTCPDFCNTCFCNWVGSGPADAEGSDILMTDVKGKDGADGFVLEAVTEAGEALLKSLGLEDGASLLEGAKAQRKAVLDAMPKAPDLSKAHTLIADKFTDVEFWQKQTAQCLSCGGCTYFCPTCYCFNITDEGDGLGEKEGRRLRTWDSCMSSHFTREASGHNPRVSKALRMRNRVSHKFSNYPIVWDGMQSCNGCGRCISQCPVHLDIRAIVLAAVTA